MSKLWMLILVLAAMSCGKEATEIKVDAHLFGKWIQRTGTLVEIKLERTSRFDTFDKGYTFFEDGTFIERSEGGICIGENCITEDYYGTVDWLDTDQIRLRVTNFNGPSDLTYTFKISADQELTLVRQF